MVEEVSENEEKREDLYSETGFEFNQEIDALKAMLILARKIHKGYMPQLIITKESIKNSVKELCDFFCKFVDCL